MRLYQHGTTVAFAVNGDFDYYNPSDELPSGAYVGQKVFDENGDEYRICKAGAAINISLTALMTSSNFTASNNERDVTATQLATVSKGEREIAIGGSALTAGAFAGGYLEITAGNNPGVLRIAGNGTDYIELANPLPFALPAAGEGRLRQNIFIDVRTAGADNHKAAGAAAVDIAKGDYFLAKTRGPELMTVEALAATFGNLTTAASGALNDGTTEIVGHAARQSGTFSSGSVLCYLNVS